MEKEMPKISRQQMLLEMEMAEGKPFLIKVISVEDGRVCCIERGLYSGQKREVKQRAVNKDGGLRKVSSMKETGKIPITNLDAPEGQAFRTPYVSHIIQYNRWQVRH